MSNIDIANILYNVLLNMDYMDYEDCWTDEIRMITGQIDRLDEMQGVEHLKLLLVALAENFEEYKDWCYKQVSNG